jgi:hypothetical protein
MDMLEQNGESRSPIPAEFRSTGPLATERQVSYLNALRDGKDLSPLTEVQRKWLAEADFAKIPKNRAGQVIEQLIPLKWKPKTKNTGYPEVADGRYAIPGEDGKLRFYSVKNGHSQIFVDVWASAERFPIRNPSEKARILKAIAADPDAGPRFGREIGACYVCGRTLTDDLSRRLGIGPVC